MVKKRKRETGLRNEKLVKTWYDFKSLMTRVMRRSRGNPQTSERDFFIDNLLVRIPTRRDDFSRTALRHGNVQRDLSSGMA